MLTTLLFPLVLNTQVALASPTVAQLSPRVAAVEMQTLIPPVAPKPPSAPVRVSTTEAPDDVVVTPEPVYQAPQALTFQTLPAPWGCISWNESTWNLAAVNPQTGDAGAFQISNYMWDKYKTASMPWLIPSATLAQQLQVAQTIQQLWGWNQWETAPLCGE